MKTKELLLECKVKLKIESDYALAKKLNIPTQRIADYMSGKSKPDEYACFKIAETLKRDPAVIIAEVQVEKAGKNKEYWVNFLIRRGVLTAVMLCLTCTIFLSIAPESEAQNLVGCAALVFLVIMYSHNVYYVKLKKVAIKILAILAGFRNIYSTIFFPRSCFSS